MVNIQDFSTSVGLGGGAVLQLTLREDSQNVGLNQSTDAWSLVLYKGAYGSFNASPINWSANINGTAYSGTFTFDFSGGLTSKLIASNTLTVTHNANGTKTISVSGTIASTGTSTGGPATASGSFAQTTIAPSAPTGATVSRLSHTLTLPQEYLAFAATEADVFSAVQATAAEISLATLPTDLSTAPVKFPTDAGSALDAFNAVLRTEQGSIYSYVTGTLTTPVQQLKVRARTRPVAATASWGIESDVYGPPDFVRDITNMVSTMVADGPTQDVSYTDPTLTARVGSANSSESVLFTNYNDLLAWAQDRVQRGASVQLRLASVTVDGMNTATDRTTDLLALTPGDRHQFTNNPLTQLGFSAYDGWLLGASETHSLTEHTFTLYFQPVLPNTAVMDSTFAWMADGALSLFAGITASDVSMQVQTSFATTFLETVTFPYTLLIDSEQVTVTGCTGAAPQVATITRGANGTTAASHSSGALVEVTPSSLFAF